MFSKIYAGERDIGLKVLDAFNLNVTWSQLV